MKCAGTLRDALRKESDTQLLALLERSGAYLQERAALELGRRRLKRAIGPLRVRLSSPDARVREAAAEALGEIGDPVAGEDLLKLFADRRQPEGVRDTCAWALARLRYRPALAQVCTALGDPSPSVRACSVAALAAIGDPSVCGRVEAALRTERDENVKSALARLLKRLKSAARAGAHVPSVSRRPLRALAKRLG